MARKARRVGRAAGIALALAALARIATEAPVRIDRLWLPGVSRTATKKGVGLTYVHCGDVAAVGASWYYRWQRTPPECAGQSVSMIWGKQDVCKPVTGDSRWLLGFNEPDRSNQANLSPDEAARLWHDVARCYPDHLLVGPSVSHPAIMWLEQFYGAYLHKFGQKPVLDALAVHCYANSADECMHVVRAVIALAERWNVGGGVWVTEFAFWPTHERTLEEALDEARAFIAWMDAEPGVVRYAWFAARMKGDEWWMGPYTPLAEFDGGGLTAYGSMYLE